MVGIGGRQENSIHTLTDTGRSTNCALPGRNSIEKFRSRVPFALTFPDIENFNDNCSNGARILVFSGSLVGRPRTLGGSRIMRRGSIQTWESLARRQSSNMSQFASSRSEFMTSDLGLNDIEYERKGGFFMTNKKTAIAVSAVVLVIIAAGFVGAYIGSVHHEKVYDTQSLIDSDIGCDNVSSSKFSLSESIRPSRYRIELSPIIEDEPISRLRGRVVIEFQYDDSPGLEKLVINAKRINVTRTKLMSLITSSPSNSNSRRRRNPEGNNTGEVGVDSMITKEENTTALPMESFTNVTEGSSDSTANHTVDKENMDNNSTTNSTSLEDHEHLKALPVSPADKVNMTVRNGVKPLTEEGSNTDNFPHSTKFQPSTPELEESSISGTSDKNESSEIEINESELDTDGGFLVLHTKSPIEAGKYWLEIDYEVPIDGYAISIANSSKKWSPALGKNPTNIRNFFPLFDDVRMKARFYLTVPRPSDLKIYSNMPIENSTAFSNEWILDTFEETPVISPDNLAVTATEQLEILGQRVLNVTFWAETLRSDAVTYLIDIVETTILGFLDLFKMDLPLPKLDIIGLRVLDHNSANPGLIKIQETLYSVDDNSAWVTRELAFMEVISLIGQQWLGGFVNARNSSDAWIVESSLLYLRHRLMGELNPAFNHSTFIMDVQPSALEADGYSVSRSVQSKLSPLHSSSFHSNEAYAAGACLIRMLHGVLRQTEFHAGYRSFVSRWTGSNADVASFWEAMTLNSSETEQPEDKANLGEIMNLWTTENGYPVITVTRNYETGSAVVHQARFSYDKSSSGSQQLWHIPLSWITKSSGNQTSIQWMKAETDKTLDTLTEPGNISWLVLNPTKSGYFRVNYDEDNWKLLAEALRSDHKSFSPETRASLIDDVFSLAFAGLIPYSTVFDVIGYLPANERDPEPWTYLLHHAMKLNLALYDSPVYFNYQEFMVKFLTDLYTEVGSQIIKGTRLTKIAHNLACIFDYPDYFAWAKKNYAGSENSTGFPINYDVPSYLHKNLLCAFAKRESELGWQWWHQKFTNVTNREERNSLLSSLACFQVPSMLQAVLNAIVYSPSFEENDALVILENFANYPAASQTALQFVEGNWKKITKRSNWCKIASAFLYASSTAFTSEKDIEDFQSFRTKNFNSLKHVGYITGLLEAKANASVSFLQNSLDELQTILGNTTSL